MIIECVEIAVPPAKREEMRRALTAWTGPAGVEPGCLSCRILQDAEDPDAFCYEAKWRSEEDLLWHLRSDHYKHLLVLMDMADRPPLIQFHTVVETSGIDLVQRARNAA